MKQNSAAPDVTPTPSVPCPACRSSIPEDLFNLPDYTGCPSCGAFVQVHAFPTLRRPSPACPVGERILADGEASCQYHPTRKATQWCAQCGRFLCTVCTLPMGDHDLCPACLETERHNVLSKDLVTRRTLYDGTALFLALGMMPFVFSTIITAPAALFVAVKYWRAPSSLIPRTKARMVAAAVISLAQIAGWAWAAGYAMLWLVRQW